MKICRFSCFQRYFRETVEKTRQIPNHDNAASECNHGYPQNLATSMPAFYTGQKEQTAEQNKLR